MTSLWSGASLSPREISLSTISELLALYNTISPRVYRNKLKPKPRTKPVKNPKASTAQKDDDEIENKVQDFVDLDKWRYISLPTILSQRLSGQSAVITGKKGEKRLKNDNNTCNAACLTKEELVRLMDWKLKHGSFRPALLGLIRSNQDSHVESITRTAISCLDLSSSSSSSGTIPFPDSSLKTLTDGLRGVGPATASLILSAAVTQDDGNGIPFFSDELFWWLCLDRYPEHTGDMNSDKRRSDRPKMKYNIKEYQQLWDAVRTLKRRIDLMGEDSSDTSRHVYSVRDMEKIAFAIGHIEMSDCSDERTVTPQVPPVKVAESERTNLDNREASSTVTAMADNTEKVGSRKRKRERP